jgi:hypothetical protein
MAATNPAYTLKPGVRTPLYPALWIVVCTVLNCAGWLLSAAGQLNAAGYLVMFVVLGAVVFWLYRQANIERFEGGSFYRPKRRFRRAMPLGYLALAVLTFLGGAIYAPTNYDALAYRIPRVLHWLGAGHWHWIHTSFNRVNTRACGVEWLLAPLITFTKTDRLIFLTNTISFLLLPGMLFSMLTRLGVRRRAAWFWMWLLPSGYTFVVQAGSIGNDMFGAVFAVAAMDFALRARASRKAADLWLAILAGAMLTGCKTSNLPLMLPWLIAVFPALPALFGNIAASTVICLIAAGASFLPMAALNYKYCGDWSGAAAEQPVNGRKHKLMQVEHNTLLLLTENLVPPIFPLAGAWNKAVVNWIPPERAKALATSFEPGQATLKLPEMQTEEGAALGMGCTVLLGIGLLAKLAGALRRRPELPWLGFGKAWVLLVCLTPYLALIVFMTQAGWSTIGRLITPYYALLMPVILRGREPERLARNRLWTWAGMAVFLLAALLVAVVPGRPLWPTQTILGSAGAESPVLKRIKSVYAVYAARANCFAPAIAALPPDLKVLGMVTFDDPEGALWKPYGSRRIEHVSMEDSREELQSRGVEYILVSSDKFEIMKREPFPEWLKRLDAEVVRTISLDLRASMGPIDWYLVKLK